MIPVLFNTLFVFIPLIFFKTTSELFEFNKIIILYIFTILIVGAWAIKSISQRKLIFRRTMLDWPIIGYLLILILSTFFSLDPRTSILGYYSRFNGGLLSQVCYALLYWVMVSNLTKKETAKSMYYILVSTLLASFIAILEHFGFFVTCGLMKLGFNESCWVQDVQSRVFSTLGQPNWLAALVTAVIPLGLLKSLGSKKIDFRFFVWAFISNLFFVTLLFTKSKSGLGAIGVELLIFWGFVFWKEKFKFVKQFLILNFLFGLSFLLIQSPFTGKGLQSETPTGPALEVGGTGSGTIRKYVWLGALEVFKNSLILGTGPETFAYSFPRLKPIDHNLTSEWDFVYNKAHNEYLNALANTGILGFLSYLSIIIASLIILYKSKRYELLTGYIAILVTNFFGFSVVPVSLLFFLFPAISLTYNLEPTTSEKGKGLKSFQIMLVTVIVIIASYLLYLISRYFIADIHYNKAKLFNRSGNVAMAKTEISKSLKISKSEPLYLNELGIAENNVEPIKEAVSLSPYNINLLRSLAGIYSKGNKIQDAMKTIDTAIGITPNDPKLYYQMGIYFIKLGSLPETEVYLKKSIELKPNYKDARFALGLTYIDLKEFKKAENELNYILENIDSKDELTKKYLDNLIQAQK
jgi:tetratricopeptide (TPR) repeat protein